MREEEKIPPENNRKKSKRLLRTLLLISLTLALVLTVQIGIVYWEGQQAGDNAGMLLSAFRSRSEAAAKDAAASPTPGVEETPAGTPGAPLSGSPSPDAAGNISISPDASAEPVNADALAAEHADEHRAAGAENENVDESAAYVQPDMPSVSERDKIIAEVVDKVGEDGIIGVLEIPEIDIELPVIGKWSYSLLKISVCRYKGPAANGKGNLVIVGHNYKNGSHFGKLDELSVGSKVYLTDLDSNRVCYKVYEIKTISPTSFSALDSYKGESGLTLFTCINSGTNRQIFRCERVGAE